jgi:hypothetical protein
MTHLPIKTALAALLIMGISAPGAFAAESYVDQLRRMEAQLTLLQKKQSLDRVRTEIAGAAFVADAPLPSVVSIYGDARNGMSAKVRFENGLVMEVKEGDSVGSKSVTKITPTKVIVGKDVALALAVPLSADAGASASASAGGPPPPGSASFQLPPLPSVGLPPLLPAAAAAMPAR